MEIIGYPPVRDIEYGVGQHLWTVPLIISGKPGIPGKLSGKPGIPGKP